MPNNELTGYFKTAGTMTYDFKTGYFKNGDTTTSLSLDPIWTTGTDPYPTGAVEWIGMKRLVTDDELYDAILERVIAAWDDENI